MRIRSLDDLVSLYETRAEGRYGLSAVNQLQHALQSAALATQQTAEPDLVLACLFHDVGHILAESRDIPADRGIDGQHEISGARVLGTLFGKGVSEPVRLHVVAKRYLCSTRAGYADLLSADSVRSFKLQGGFLPMADQQRFESEAYCKQAIALRLIDDSAKDPQAQPPSLQSYRDLMAARTRATVA